jgi:transketolase
MRSAFLDELLAVAQRNPRVVLVVGDLGFGVVEPFAERFPDRFFNAGVAEQNMMGLCAGLASEGCHVFAYSIANFPTFRCAEQIRNDVDYHNLAVTIVAVGGGVAYGNLGYSHHAVQDYALMRVLPNMLIAAPGDPLETRACVRYLVENPGPSYLRLGKAGEPEVHESIPAVVPGEWVELVKPAESANRAAILTTGAPLALARQWLRDGEYQSHGLFSLPLWGMRHKAKQAAMAEPFEHVVTVEDHIADAGFGSWFREALHATDSDCRVSSRALSSDIFGKVGAQKTLNTLGGL